MLGVAVVNLAPVPAVARMGVLVAGGRGVPALTTSDAKADPDLAHLGIEIVAKRCVPTTVATVATLTRGWNQSGYDASVGTPVDEFIEGNQVANANVKKQFTTKNVHMNLSRVDTATVVVDYMRQRLSSQSDSKAIELDRTQGESARVAVAIRERANVNDMGGLKF